MTSDTYTYLIYWVQSELSVFPVVVSFTELLTAAYNIINQLKPQTLKCLLQPWKGFFERMKSVTPEAEVRQLSKAVLTFQTPVCDVSSILLLLIQQESLSVWLRITYSIPPETLYVFLSLNLNFLACWEKS